MTDSSVEQFTLQASRELQLELAVHKLQRQLRQCRKDNREKLAKTRVANRVLRVKLAKAKKTIWKQRDDLNKYDTRPVTPEEEMTTTLTDEERYSLDKMKRKLIRSQRVNAGLREDLRKAKKQYFDLATSWIAGEWESVQSSPAEGPSDTAGAAPAGAVMSADEI